MSGGSTGQKLLEIEIIRNSQKLKILFVFNRVPFPPLDLWALNTEALLIPDMTRKRTIPPRPNSPSPKSKRSDSDGGHELSWVTVKDLPQREQLKHYLQVCPTDMIGIDICVVCQFFMIIRRVRLCLREVLHRILQAVEDQELSSNDNHSIHDSSTTSAPFSSGLSSPFSSVEFYGVKCLLERELLEPSPLGLDWFQEGHDRRRLKKHSETTCVCPLCLPLNSDKPAGTTQPLEVLIKKFVMTEYLSRDTTSSSNAQENDSSDKTTTEYSKGREPQEDVESEQFRESNRKSSSEINDVLKTPRKRSIDSKSNLYFSIPKLWYSLRHFTRHSLVLDLRDTLFPNSPLLKSWTIAPEIVPTDQITGPGDLPNLLMSVPIVSSSTPDPPASSVPKAEAFDLMLDAPGASTEVLEDSLTHAMSQPYCSFSSASESDESNDDSPSLIQRPQIETEAPNVDQTTTSDFNIQRVPNLPSTKDVKNQQLRLNLIKGRALYQVSPVL